MGSVGDTISLSIGERRGMKMTMKLSRIAVAAVLLSGITATAGAGQARADDSQKFYVVHTNFTSKQSCDSYWNKFIDKDGNWRRYERHTCTKNKSGKFTLTAYYSTSGGGGGGGGVGSWIVAPKEPVAA